MFLLKQIQAGDDNNPNNQLDGIISSRRSYYRSSDEISYASGSSLMDDRYAIDIEPDGYIFAISDLSYKKQLFNGHGNVQPAGTNSGLWPTAGWGAPNAQFQPPGGPTHITVLLRFDQ